MGQETRWLKRYNEVMELMERKHRKPSQYYLEEKLMFHFIRHNKILYNAGSLKPEHKKTMRLFVLIVSIGSMEVL